MTDRRTPGPRLPRLGPALTAALTVAAGLGIRSWAEGDLAKYAGDALYTTLICALAGVLAPRLRPVTAAGAALGFSWAVELSQLTGLPAELSQRSGLARLVLGSTFNAPDLLWYIAGAALGLLLRGPVDSLPGRVLRIFRDQAPASGRGVLAGEREAEFARRDDRGGL